MAGPSRLSIKRVLWGTDLSQPTPLPAPAQITASIRNLLAEPTWSVRSLLPSENTHRSSETVSITKLQEGKLPKQEITKEKLHHLLRLSALPLPKSALEEQKLLNSLHRHLHFVRAVQNVDTTKPPTWETPRPNPNDPVATKIWNPDLESNHGEVEPLVTIRDETYEAIGESTVHLRDLWPSLLKEEKRGMNKAVRRRWKINTDWEDDRKHAEEIMGATRPSSQDGEISLSDAAMIAQEKEKALAKRKQALSEKRDWWIDVDRLGGGTESRKKGRYFFVQKSKPQKGVEGSSSNADTVSEPEMQSNG